MIKLSELVKSPEKYAGDITVSGWIKTARESKNIGFIELTDGSCFKTVQVVYQHDDIPDDVKKSFATGSAVEVTGELLLTPDAQQPFEIQGKRIAVVGVCDADYPL